MSHEIKYDSLQQWDEAGEMVWNEEWEEWIINWDPPISDEEREAWPW